MTQKLNRTVFLFFSILVLVSCKSPKPVLSEEKTKIITLKETVHDTVFKIQKDSSSFKALLECQNGKVVFKNVTQAEPGRTLKSPKVRLDNNKLAIDCELKEQELYARWKSQQIKETEVQTIRTTKFVNHLTSWQKLQIWLGRLLFIVVLFLVIRFVYKIYKPLWFQ
jgi:Fe2+ transport system protein B